MKSLSYLYSLKFVLLLFITLLFSTQIDAQDAILNFDKYNQFHKGKDSVIKGDFRVEFFKNKINIYQDDKLFFKLKTSNASKEFSPTTGNYIRYDAYETVVDEIWIIYLYENGNITLTYDPHQLTGFQIFFEDPS